jgi:hypothetical protein
MTSDEGLRHTLTAARDEVDEPETRQLYDFYLRLIQRLAARKASLPTSPLPLPATQAAAAERLSAGQPLADFDAEALASHDFGAWACEVRDLLGERDPGLPLEADELSAEQALALAEQSYHRGLTGAGPAYDTILANALIPWLERTAEAAQPLLGAAAWEHTYCPVCGGPPDFAALEPGDQERTLLCERCRTEWRVPPDFCVFCGEDDPGHLGYFATEDDTYRVEVCDSCNSYLKVIRRAAHPDALLAAERLLTPGLDLLAAEHGYTRPAGWEPMNEDESD